MSAEKILVATDDPHTRRVITAALVVHGYEVLDARTGDRTLKTVLREMPHLLLLDMNMPGISGLEVCRRVRSRSDIPVISLSATEVDMVAALDAGADGYVTKPFSIKELLARIRAVLRRFPSSPVGGRHSLIEQNLEIDFATRRVRADGVEVRLTLTECKLLQYLASHEGKPVTHHELLQAIWGPGYTDLRRLRVFITHVRKKIEPHPAKPKYILTIPWVGYKFVAPQ